MVLALIVSQAEGRGWLKKGNGELYAVLQNDQKSRHVPGERQINGKNVEAV